MNAPLQICFIHHGETAWSLSGQHTGRTDLPLTPRGESMALGLASALQGIAFSLVLTSPRLRARSTCRLAGLGAAAQVEPNLATRLQALTGKVALLERCGERLPSTSTGAVTVTARRRFVIGAAACATALPSLTACSTSASEQDAARALRRITPSVTTSPGSGGAAIKQTLVRYATLAPSSHNTQCWRFYIAPTSIAIAPDPARRCPAVDPDDHHVFVSLGCATENLVHAALAMGFHADARFDPSADGRIAVSLEATQPSASPLFHAITERQCTRGDYDGHALTPAELKLLEAAGTGQGVSVRLLTARPAIESVLDFVVAGNTAQMSDPAFSAELKAWIRFGADEALRTGDGLFTGASGNPALPRWLGSRMMDLFFTPKSENERYARQIRNSAGLAVFVSERSDPAHWIEAGRCYERFALQATALGIRNAMLNQPVEVAAIRPQFAAWLGLAPHERPDLVVRFGRGPGMPLSMRRPVQAVLA